MKLGREPLGDFVKTSKDRIIDTEVLEHGRSILSELFDEGAVTLEMRVLDQATLDPLYQTPTKETYSPRNLSVYMVQRPSKELLSVLGDKAIADMTLWLGYEQCGGVPITEDDVVVFGDDIETLYDIVLVYPIRILGESTGWVITCNEQKASKKSHTGE